jgi:hypothetical protein
VVVPAAHQKLRSHHNKLAAAREAIADITSPHLQSQIELGLAELHEERHEQQPAAQAVVDDAF